MPDKSLPVKHFQGLPIAPKVCVCPDFLKTPKLRFTCKERMAKPTLARLYGHTEVRPIAEVFHDLGFSVWVFPLPGHGDGAAIN